MADAETSPSIEDLEVDGDEADAVRGGMTQKQRQAEVTRLEHHGWKMVSCEPQGDVFVNPKTHETKIVPYVH